MSIRPPNGGRRSPSANVPPREPGSETTVVLAGQDLLFPDQDTKIFHTQAAGFTVYPLQKASLMHAAAVSVPLLSRSDPEWNLTLRGMLLGGGASGR